MKYIEDFIRDCCIIDVTQKERSSLFYAAYKSYLENKEDVHQRFNNSTFSQWFSKRIKLSLDTGIDDIYSNIAIIHNNKGTFYIGICLKDNYVDHSDKKVSKVLRTKEDIRKYNREYYNQNKGKRSDKRKKIKYQKMIEEFDILMSQKANISPEEILQMRLAGLCLYAYDNNGNVHWDNTIKYSLLCWDHYKQNNQIHSTDPVETCPKPTDATPMVISFKPYRRNKSTSTQRSDNNTTTHTKTDEQPSTMKSTNNEKDTHMTEHSHINRPKFVLTSSDDPAAISKIFDRIQKFHNEVQQFALPDIDPSSMTEDQVDQIKDIINKINMLACYPEYDMEKKMENSKKRNLLRNFLENRG